MLVVVSVFAIKQQRKKEALAALAGSADDTDASPPRPSRMVLGAIDDVHESTHLFAKTSSSIKRRSPPGSAESIKRRSPVAVPPPTTPSLLC